MIREQKKFVSIIVPCLNEEAYIGKCLDSILGQDYPHELMEILVADGMSGDNTRGVLEDYAARHACIRWFENSLKSVPSGLNILIGKAKGQVIVRLDVHSSYPADYVSKCVQSLESYGADNVGGVCITCPQKPGLLGEAIVFVLSHRFGVGNSLFRLGVKKPTEVDTVPFGCFRREVFDKIGLFNENLVRNQDIEFNLRLKKSGGKIMLMPDVTSYYYARSDLKGLARNNFSNGFWVLYSMKFAQLPFSMRHLVPFAFVVSLLGSLLLSFFVTPFIWFFALEFMSYFLFSIFVSISIAREKGMKYFINTVVSFWVLHISYGLGSLCGLACLLIPFKK